jgi:hypothetical protein
VKRENLVTDPSDWQGWEVHARTNKRDIFLIIQRRKYLPPFMENYAEMVFVLYGPDDFKTLEEEKIVEEKEEEEVEEEEEEEEEEEGKKNKKKSSKSNKDDEGKF